MGEGRPHTIYKVCSVYKKTIVTALLIHYEWPCMTNNKWPPPCWASPAWHTSCREEQRTSSGLIVFKESRTVDTWMTLITEVAIRLKIWWNWGSGTWKITHNRMVLAIAVQNSDVRNQIPLEGVKKPGKDHRDADCLCRIPPLGHFSHYKIFLSPHLQNGTKVFFLKENHLKILCWKMLYSAQVLSSSSIEPLYFFLCPVGNNKLTYFLSSEILLRPQCDCTPVHLTLIPIKNTQRGESRERTR